MSRRFNGKALVDELTTRLWDTGTANRERVIEWCNEIMNDIVSDIPLDKYKFKLKKLLPLQQEIISLKVDVPTAPTTALSTGGSLVDTSSYKAYVSFIVWDEDLREYMEGEISPAGTEQTATATDATIDLTGIPLFGGDTSFKPATIYRRIYVATKTAAATSYGEPFFLQDIKDNTTTTLSITTAPTSTRTPVSQDEVDQIASDSPYFLNSGRVLERVDIDDTRRYNPQYSESDTPYIFDYVGTDRINLYPRLSSSATTAQRTLTYFVHRRPHEVFYDVDCDIDLPISLKKVLVEGVIWKGYEFRDRDGVQTKLGNYQQMKTEAKRKMKRLRNRPSTVRDVTGDTYGFSV